MAFISINSLLILTGVLAIKNRADEKSAQNSPEFSEVTGAESKADALSTANDNIKADTAAISGVTGQNKKASSDSGSISAPKTATPVVKPKTTSTTTSSKTTSKTSTPTYTAPSTTATSSSSSSTKSTKTS